MILTLLFKRRVYGYCTITRMRECISELIQTTTAFYCFGTNVTADPGSFKQ